MNKKRKILIVDDSATIIKAIQSFITEDFLYEPFYASSFSDAETLIKQHNFFTAILDLELPDAVSGEMVDYAIAHKINPIVLTGTFNETLRKQILQKPIVDYIVKHSIQDIKEALVIAENLIFFDQKVVLIVDDSKLARIQLRQLFEVLSFYVIEASSGQEALKKLSDLPQVDIITIDYEMPGMDGIELIQQIRKMNHLVQPMIFAISSSASELDKAKFLKNGANDYFIKPAQKEEFNHKLGNYLRIITQRENLIKSQKIVAEYNRALNIGGYVSKTDPNGTITFVSDKFLALTGYERNELIGKNHNVLKHPNTPKDIYKELWHTILNKEIWSGVLKNTKKNGDIFYTRSTIIPILDHEDQITEFVTLRDDVTELITSQEKLQAHYKTDVLTSLGNRIKFLDDFEKIENPFIAFLNVSRFKEINAEFGYRTGDKVLIKVGDILHTFSKPHSISIYRLHSDEFAILINNTSLLDFQNLCVIIHDKISSTPFLIDENTIPIEIKIGIAHGKFDTLLYADMALKEAKTSSENIVLYHEAIKSSQEYKNTTFWKSKIINGIQNDLFIPYYQPIIDNQTGKIFKYEALIRLKDDQSIITPIHFLNVAKKTHYYFELTKLMIRKTFQVFSANDSQFSINFSVNDINNQDVISYFKNQLYEHIGIQKRLTIEILESEGIENFEAMTLFIRQMKELGCKIAIDDFGTGYSNFEYLMKLNVDYIKIDGSLIRSINQNSSHYDIVESIVGFAKKNAIKVIAEFVSNEEIYHAVCKLGIDYSQGFYFAEPTEHLALI